MFIIHSRAYHPDVHAARAILGGVQGGKLVFTNVIVPLDGSHDAEAAIPVARTLAALGRGRLSFLRVVNRPAGLFASHANQVREASTYLDGLVRDQLALRDLAVSTHVRSGDVV